MGIAGLHTLTETYDEHSYRRFLESFGTHYVKKSTMGAIFGEQSMISAESWTYMVQQGWNIGIMAGMSAGFSGNINMTIDYNETERETFDSTRVSNFCTPEVLHLLQMVKLLHGPVVLL